MLPQKVKKWTLQYENVLFFINALIAQLGRLAKYYIKERAKSWKNNYFC